MRRGLPLTTRQKNKVNSNEMMKGKGFFLLEQIHYNMHYSFT